MIMVDTQMSVSYLRINVQKLARIKKKTLNKAKKESLIRKQKIITSLRFF